MRDLVALIGQTTTWFVEIVNFNVRSHQYVCAGDLRALETLQRCVDELKPLLLAGPLGDNDVLTSLITKHATHHTNANTNIAPSILTLKRGVATVPLPGIDVPFHSSFLLPRMPAFRQVLLSNLESKRIRPERLIGKYVPNVTGKPFSIEKEYFEEVATITGSKKVKDVLAEWDSWMERVKMEKKGPLGTLETPTIYG